MAITPGRRPRFDALWSRRTQRSRLFVPSDITEIARQRPSLTLCRGSGTAFAELLSGQCVTAYICRGVPGVERGRALLEWPTISGTTDTKLRQQKPAAADTRVGPRKRRIHPQRR